MLLLGRHVSCLELLWSIILRLRSLSIANILLSWGSSFCGLGLTVLLSMSILILLLVLDLVIIVGNFVNVKGFRLLFLLVGSILSIKLIWLPRSWLLFMRRAIWIAWLFLSHIICSMVHVMVVWMNVVYITKWLVGYKIAVNSWYLWRLSELLWDWLNRRAALWVMWIGLLLKLVTFGGLKNFIVRLFILFLSSLSLRTLEILTSLWDVIKFFLLSEVWNLRFFEDWDSDLLLFCLLRVKLDFVFFLQVNFLMVLVVIWLSFFARVKWL